MKYFRYFALGFLTFIAFGASTTHAQQDLAQQAYAVLQQNCLTCHGPAGAFRETLLLEHTALLETGAVVPGKPAASELYTRLLEKDPIKRMPLGQPKLSDPAILAIQRWIQAGARDWDWDPSPNSNFITYDAMLTTIQRHVASLDPFDRPFARYFSLTHLYNAGESPNTLNIYRMALSKLINSLSWREDIINLHPIDAAKTIFYVSLFEYEWDAEDVWTQLEAVYPYRLDFDVDLHAGLHKKLADLREEMDCEVPFMQVDWFLATASLPPLYHDILGLPATERELEDKLDVDVAGNIAVAPGRRVWRAGFNDSGPSKHNRVVERHRSGHGAYWKSYDFAGSAGVRNIFTHPLGFQHDGGEVIFHLPNGLQGYYISDGLGNRIDAAPLSIVSNEAASDKVVRNGLSCIGCHTEGMKTFTDTVRGVVEQTRNPPYDRDHALRLYVEQAEMDGYVSEDMERYKAALEATGNVFGGIIEPVSYGAEAFQGPLDASHAAAAIGMEAAAFLAKIRSEQSLQRFGLTGLLSGENVKRDVWESNFSDVVACLYGDECAEPPPPPPPFFIPDPNLRAAVAETLGKAPGELIPEDMQRLTHLSADEQGIRDLTGLEYATKLERIELRHNAISDLSPLAGLTHLHNIKLRGNRIRDVSPLAELFNVDWLGLEENEISDFSPLAGLKKLAGIGISGNPVSDVSALAALTSLEGIDAVGTNISDVSPLASLPRLKWLQVSANDSKSLDFVKPLKSLRRLEVRNGSISDISAVSEFRHLQTLTLDHNLISDVSPLAKLKGLRYLYIRHNLISDVSPLAALGNLEGLDLRDNAIADASPIQTLINKGVVKWHHNPAFPHGGAKIAGPWLWVMLPDSGFLNDTDLLAEASQGKVTQRSVATEGATEGAAVGNRLWTAHTLKTEGSEGNWWDNITEMLKDLGWSADRVSNQVVYGSVLISSPQEQKTTMFVGSDDNHKVWLNGELVGENLNWLWSHNYQDFFPVTLKQGTNVLLVAVQTGGGAFSGFFGFAPDAKYKVIPPGARFAFATQTPRLSVGETLTLHVRAEKVSDLAGYQTNITYNPDVLKANGVREGGFLKQAPGQTFFEKGKIQNRSGEIRGIKTARLQGGVSGTGTLVSITFTAIAAGRTTVKLRNFQAGTPKGKAVPAFAPEITIQVGGGAVSRPAWDVNQDGITDAQDLLLVTLALGEQPPKNPRTDINGDGVVDAKDAAIVTEHLGEGQAPAAPLQAQTLAQLTPETVLQAIEFLRTADDGSAVYSHAITRLQELLTLLIPEKTRLLANYPNPFNPETWLPYQLAKDSEVSITIYNTTGVVVRRLHLGHQPAGYYTDRSRAAYWDGRNAVGEPVASGVYFYTLTADEFTATRKMLIRK